MKTKTEQPDSSITGQTTQTWSSGFKPVIKLLMLSFIAAVIAQDIFLWPEQSGLNSWIGIIGAVLAGGAFIYFYGKPLYRLIDKPYFAISSLLFIAFGTAMGTLVVQNALPDVFVRQYGESGSKLLRFFQLNDVFHSWWYVLAYLLLAISLVKLSLQRSFIFENLGFHLAHLSPIVVLAGVWVDYFAGFRGIIPLNTGQETSFVNVYQTGTNRINDSINLDFKVRLHHFEFENFEPDHRIQLWRNETALQEHEGSIHKDTIGKILASFPMEAGMTQRIYNTDISLHLAEYYPNFYLEYSYSERPDTIEPNAPGIMLELTTPHGKDLLQLMANVPGRNIFDLPTLGAALEFHWELPAEYERAIADFSPGLEFAKGNRILFHGRLNVFHEIINGQLITKAIDLDSFYLIAGKENVGFAVYSVFPDIAYLSSEPQTRDNKQGNPVARIEVSAKGWSEPENAFLYPSWKGPGGQYYIPGTDYFLALESIKDKETKYWKSDIALIDKNGAGLKRKSIKVNEPLTYGNYRFYQTDYDPNNPNYSGIGVSYTPGLYIVYAGFYILALGVLMLFYMRHRDADLIG